MLNNYSCDFLSHFVFAKILCDKQCYTEVYPLLLELIADHWVPKYPYKDVPALYVPTLKLLAQVELKIEKEDLAIERLETCKAILKREQKTGNTYYNVVDDLLFLYKNKGDNKMMELNCKELMSLTDKQDKYYAELLYVMINILFTEKRYSEVYPYAIEFKELCKNLYGNNSQVYGDSCNTLAVALMELGKLKEAEDELNLSYKILYSIYGKENPWYSIYLHNMGRLYLEKKDYKKAIKSLSQAKELQIQQEGKPFERTVEYLERSQNKK